MGQKHLVSNEADYFLNYEELIKIVPTLKDKLTKENSFEFSKQLYEFTKIIYEQYKNEKEKLNS
jgi:heme oxygenase